MKLFSENKDKLFHYAAIVAYVLLNAFVLFHHEPWRDEAQAWLIARDTNFWGLLNEIRYQQNPPLWYLILLPFAKLGLPYPGTLQIIHFLISVTAVSVFILKAPVRPLLKYLFAFSYFMSFEYVIISRNYSIAILLLFLIASFYPQRFRRPLFYSVLIFLLFLSNYLCFAPAVGLVVLFAWEFFRQGKPGKDFKIALAIMILGGAISFFFGAFLPADHYRHIYPVIPRYYAFFESLTKTLSPFIVIKEGEAFCSFLAVVILCFVILAEIRKPQAIFLVLIAYGGVFYILSFYISSLRHQGFILVLLWLVYWIAQYYPETDWLPFADRFFRRIPTRKISEAGLMLLGICLAFSLYFMVVAQKWEVGYHFSGSRVMAQAIKKISGLIRANHGVIVVHPSPEAASVIAYLPGLKFWQADYADYGTYWRQGAQFDYLRRLTSADVVVRAGIYFRGLDRLFFLLAYPLSFSEAYGYEFKLIDVVNRGVFGYSYETFYLYKAIPLRRIAKQTILPPDTDSGRKPPS
ncbi:MAG: hypothetical protein PHN49_12635 [Candidatus Omnitrophica bacterium]|nr:hypothetical protein [Candidatus Omnitrophota bacterium]MDD5672472.1 hypothetical protein [Candidatus Omnitrophota bacterium]